MDLFDLSAALPTQTPVVQFQIPSYSHTAYSEDRSRRGSRSPPHFLRQNSSGFHPADLVVSLRQAMDRVPSQTLTMPTLTIDSISDNNNNATLVLCCNGWRHLIELDVRVLVDGLIISERMEPPRPAPRPAPPAGAAGSKWS